MSIRFKRLRDVRSLLPLHSSGRCYQISRSYQTSRRVVNSFSRNIVNSPHECRNTDNGALNCVSPTHRFSTVSETGPKVDFLSLIGSALDKLEGPSHYWLNRDAVTKVISRSDGPFLVVAGAFLEKFLESGRDSSIVFEKVKLLQQRYPSLNVIGYQSSKPVRSDVIRSHLLKITMSEYITFPILVSNKTLSEMSDRVGYIVFKSWNGPLLLYDKDVDFKILDTAIKELNVQHIEKPELLHSLRGTWVKPLDIFKEPCLCSPLRNLLLYFPGCIAVDEVNGRLFLSDINHHRIIVFESNGKILDCIGSSPGFEDGEFESCKMIRPAASFYDDAEDCLYFVDSENHAIRRADMKSRVVETFYPKPIDHRTKSSGWNWITDKLWKKKEVPSNFEEYESASLLFPWHLIRSSENDLFIFNRSFETLWNLDLSSGLLKEVVKGTTKILEICGPNIMEKSSLLKQIPCNDLPPHIATDYSVDGISYAGLISSAVTFQDNIVICDTVGQMVLKYNKTTQSMAYFRFSKLGILGLPYWLPSPLEMIYAGYFGLSGGHVDHSQHYSLLPGTINIRIKVDIPENMELVEPLDEGCIWRQARGTATEVSGAENKAVPPEKVGIAQKWYDELDDLASLTEIELETEEEDTSDEKMQEGEICINCDVNTSPGTSEVIIDAALYLRMKRSENQSDDAKKQQMGILMNNLNPNTNNHALTDACVEFISTSNKNSQEFVFLRPIHVRLKIDSLDHPKAANSKDIILTESSIEVNISVK